ncbi:MULTISPECIES: hypothetical protein [unclassified Aureimonas]|uniref:hypothetical protein n=1 Tax=unclassified Aureimonas TaxID=2615206 RepID=UPI0006F2A2D6|nr:MULTISPECIES: hypothetical protein [unclassified Aureimonas]KQT61784.1 hypothetical protein ASG62_23920 [Aureimonas sp. Leaf427]KQT62217.1 hypothetical protein ASG54_23190 [Aureimonas sp. Leaf460]
MQSFFEAYPANSGRTQFAPPFADHVDHVVLAAGILLRLPIPTGAQFAVFSFDGDVRVKPGALDTLLELPVTSTAVGRGSELNPSARRLTPPQGGTPFTHLCLRAFDACNGSVSFFA